MAKNHCQLATAKTLGLSCRAASSARASLCALALSFVPLTGAQAEPSCLAVERLNSIENNGEVCRFQGAILNQCGREVHYAIVRAVPHPERGPLPTATGTLARFRLAPLNFEREICQQGHHILEVEGDGKLRDVTAQVIDTNLLKPSIMEAAERINSCVALCAPPNLERTHIVNELRQAHGAVIDDGEAKSALNDIIAAIAAKRVATDNLCASRCYGALTDNDIAPAQARIDSENRQTLAAPLAVLAALAARPVAPEKTEILPERDEGPAQPRSSRRYRSKGKALARSGNCNARGGRCRLVLNIEPRTRTGSAKKSTR